MPYIEYYSFSIQQIDTKKRQNGTIFIHSFQITNKGILSKKLN